MHEKSNFQKIVDAGLADGFDIPDARQYFTEDPRGQSHAWLYQTITTPYSIDLPEYGSCPVTGRIDVDLDFKNKDPKSQLFRAATAEAWVTLPNGTEKNLEDVLVTEDTATQLTGLWSTHFNVQNKNGQTVSLRDAQKRMTEFGAAAAVIPHVFMYDEYMEAQTITRKRFGMEPPQEEDYSQTYLDSIVSQLNNRIQFFGKIRKVSDMDIAYTSCPSVQADMEDWLREIEVQECDAVFESDFDQP